MSTRAAPGQVVAVVVMLVGIVFVAVLTGAIAQRFIAPREDDARLDGDELLRRLDDTTMAQRPDHAKRIARARTQEEACRWLDTYSSQSSCSSATKHLGVPVGA